jgi:putative N6-adenine-specific DNA methylase
VKAQGRPSSFLTKSPQKGERFFAPCPRGLEGILSTELERLNAQSILPTQGGVGFSGGFELCYRVNLESRIASRVLWRIYDGNYEHESDIYRAAYELPWGDWFSTGETIKVKVSAHRCPLPSLDYVTLRIKDAICDCFQSFTRQRPSVDTHRPDVRIDAFLDEKNLTLYLDTSGEPLFKRGFRKAGGQAPLRENLASGILSLSGWTPHQILLDPMCGSGTILIEAAQITRHIAPGLGRRFAFEKLQNFQPGIWSKLCQESRDRQRPQEAVSIYGCDRDERVLNAAQANLESAGLLQDVRLKQADVLDLQPPGLEGIIVTNPPYGVRMSEEAELARLYPRLGDALKQRFTDWRAYILTADLRLPKLIGLAASRRTLLFNGPLECRLFEFKVVRGPHRKHQTASG